MDPLSILSIVQGSLDLVAKCVTVAKYLNEFATKHQQAELFVLSLVDECQTLRLAWGQIESWARRQNDAQAYIDGQIIERLGASLETGTMAFLTKEAHVLKAADESAWTIVNSQAPTSIRDTDSVMSIESTDLVYGRLDFEDHLFTAKVYKRNFRNIIIRQLFREQAKAKSKLAIVTTPADDSDELIIGDNPDTEEFNPSEQRQHLLLDSINDELEFKMSLETQLEALASKPAKQTKKQRDEVELELVKSMRKLLELNAELEDEIERGIRPTTPSGDLNSGIVQGSSPKTTSSDEEVEDIEVETIEGEAQSSARPSGLNVVGLIWELLKVLLAVAQGLNRVHALERIVQTFQNISISLTTPEVLTKIYSSSHIYLLRQHLIGIYCLIVSLGLGVMRACERDSLHTQGYLIRTSLRSEFNEAVAELRRAAQRIDAVGGMFSQTRTVIELDYHELAKSAERREFEARGGAQARSEESELERVEQQAKWNAKYTDWKFFLERIGLVYTVRLPAYHSSEPIQDKDVKVKVYTTWDDVFSYAAILDIKYRYNPQNCRSQDMLEKDTAKIFVRIEPILWEEDYHNIPTIQDTKIAAEPSSPHLILGKSMEIQTEAVVVELEAIESEIVSVESTES